MEVCGCNAHVTSRRCGGGFLRVRGWCLSAVVSCVSPGGICFRTFSIVSLFGLWHSAMLGGIVVAVLRCSSSGAGMCVVGRSSLECHVPLHGWVRRLCVPFMKGRLAKFFRVEVSSADVGSVSNMLRIWKFMFSFGNVCCKMFVFRIDASRHDSCIAPLTWLILLVVICVSKN